MEASADDCAARGGGVVTLWEGREYALSDEAAISGLKQSYEEEGGRGGDVTLLGGGEYALSESAEQEEGCGQEGEGGSGFAGEGQGVGERRQEEEEAAVGMEEGGGLESLSSMLNELDAILGQ